MILPLLSIEMFGFGVVSKNQEDNNNNTISKELQEALQNVDEVQMDHQKEKESKILPEENNNRISKKFNPFQNLKFCGLNDMKHPKRFIENFEYFAVHENLDDYEKQYYFIQSFVADAEIWINSHGFGTYEEMKDGFIKFYWSPAIQKSFLNYLKDGVYDEDCGLSMTSYFFKYANYAKFLDDAPTEEVVVSYLYNHFKIKEIDNFIKLRPIKTIEEALAVLIKVEDMQSYESSSESDSETEEDDFKLSKKSNKLEFIKLREEYKQSEIIILRFLVCMLLIFLFALFFTLFTGPSSEQELLILKQQKLWEEVQKLK